jgi:tellurite resistance protein
MTYTIESPYTPDQIQAWLRGLLTIAWADGHFDEDEKTLIASVTEEALSPSPKPFDTLEPISDEELVETLGKQTAAAENFLRMAVMVALADGVYSSEEDQKLHSLCETLGLENQVLDSFRSTVYDLNQPVGPQSPGDSGVKPLKPAREWLDQLAVDDPRLARFICKMVPAQCPFERDVTFFGRKVAHIPAMCKLNPLYEQLVGLRFRALSYLADDCGEDVTPYI